MNCRDFERFAAHFGTEDSRPKIGVGNCATCVRFGPEIPEKPGYRKCLLGAMEGELLFTIEPPLEVQEAHGCLQWKPAGETSEPQC